MDRSSTERPITQGSFTLIELLTVIAIIALLAALLFPAIGKVKQKAKEAQARADLKAIEAAIKQYYTEYGKLPVTNSQQGVTCDFYYHTNSADCASGGIGYQYNIIDTLRAVSTSGHDNFGHVLNPRRIAFLDTPSRKNAIASNGTFQDPFWDARTRPDNIYYIKLDNNYDNAIEYYGTNALVAIVISYGYNGVQESVTNSPSVDDIVSYR